MPTEDDPPSFIMESETKPPPPYPGESITPHASPPVVAPRLVEDDRPTMDDEPSLAKASGRATVVQVGGVRHSTEEVEARTEHRVADRDTGHREEKKKGGHVTFVQEEGNEEPGRKKERPKTAIGMRVTSDIVNIEDIMKRDTKGAWGDESD